MPGVKLDATRAGAGGVMSPVPREAWAAVWEASLEATVFHTAEWLDACCQAGGFEDASRLYENSDGQRFVVPLVRPSRWPPRSSWSIPPGWVFGGAFGTRPVTAADVAMIVDDLHRDSRRLVVSPGPVNGDAWAAVNAQARVRHDVHVIDLLEGFDSLWSRSFSSDTRNKVRKAEKR